MDRPGLETNGFLKAGGNDGVTLVRSESQLCPCDLTHPFGEPRLSPGWTWWEIVPPKTTDRCERGPADQAPWVFTTWREGALTAIPALSTVSTVRQVRCFSSRDKDAVSPHSVAQLGICMHTCTHVSWCEDWFLCHLLGLSFVFHKIDLVNGTAEVGMLFDNHSYSESRGRRLSVFKATQQKPG